MEETMEETGPPVKKTNSLGKILRVLIARWNRRKDPTPVPWVRLQGRSGTRTLAWGMGDGKSFGSVPLGPEAAFSADSSGVTLHGSGSRPVVIGSPEAGEGNLLLARKIEKGLRNQGHGFRIFVFAAALLVGALLVLTLEGGPGPLRVAGISGGGPSGGGDPLSSIAGIPSSMSSGLTCRTH